MSNATLLFKKYIEFISQIWDAEAKEKYGTFNQHNIANAIGRSPGYISKAKENDNYSSRVIPELLKLIEKLGGEYIEEEDALIHDKKGKRLELVKANNSDYRLHRMNKAWIRKTLTHKTKVLNLLVTSIGETADDVMQVLNRRPELLRKVDKIKLLMLSPESVGTHLRGKSMGINMGRGFNKIKEDLQNIFEHHERLNEILPKGAKRPEIEIRLYDELPSIQLVMTDTKVLIGFYLQGLYSKNVDNLVLDRDRSEFIRQIEGHWSSIWQKYKHTSMKIEDIPARIEQFTHPPYKRFNIHRYKDFEDKSYYLYYAERYSPNEYRTHKTSATIGCNILHIEENVEGVFKCRMKAAGVDDSEQEYYGELTNINFNSPDYLIITLTNKTKTRHLSLYFSIKEKNIYNFGLFSTIYKTSGRIGSGFAVLKEAEGTYEELNPTSLSPDDIPTANHKLPNSLISYLIDRQESLLLPVTSIEQLKLEEEVLGKVAGTYYVYAYSGSAEEPQITQGVATLYENGMAEYKNRINGFDGVGWIKVDKVKDKLYIEVRNSNLKIARTALFIIDRRPLDKEKDFYGGVCASTTWHVGVPVASRIIAQRTNKKIIKGFDYAEPKKITPDSEEYIKLPLIVKQNLTGVFPNMVGFFREQDKTNEAEKNRKKQKNKKTEVSDKNRKIELSETFYKAACYDITQKDAESFLTNLKHAITHGFNDIEKLKAFKEQMPNHITEINRIKRIMEKMQKKTKGN